MKSRDCLQSGLSAIVGDRITDGFSRPDAGFTTRVPAVSLERDSTASDGRHVRDAGQGGLDAAVSQQHRGGGCCDEPETRNQTHHKDHGASWDDAASWIAAACADRLANKTVAAEQGMHKHTVRT